MRFSSLYVSIALMAMQHISSASAAFHLFLRYQNLCDVECSRKPPEVCWPKHFVEWSIGAVPSQNYNCDNFKNDRYFHVLPQWGQEFNWHGGNLPIGICGSQSVDFYTTNNGQNLEVWIHGANPGQRVATCYKQHANEIDCGSKSCDTTKVHDVWVCADTNLCS